MKKDVPTPRVVKTTVADRQNVVHTVVGGKGAYCRKVCEECPWLVANSGNFPATAFRITAHVSHDMSTHTFACHMRGPKAPATCAGFLLRGADDNLAVRLQRMRGRMTDVKPDKRDLHASYRAMAIANGVSARDRTIANCMPEARFVRRTGKQTRARVNALQKQLRGATK